MPSEGIQLNPRHDILNFDELEGIVVIFAQLGVTKVRITGGEPFARRDAIRFLIKIRHLPYPLKLFLTTNGVLAAQYISELKSINPDGINLSLDTLRSDRFFQITRRQSFDQVEKFLKGILRSKIPLKINTVIQPGINENEIISIARLAENHPVEVRFIERMPFNGDPDNNDKWYSGKEIEDHLRRYFVRMKKLKPSENSTSDVFQIEGFRGVVGIISGYARTFCSTCNRIRVSTQGDVKTCLYAQPALNLKLLLRSGWDNEHIKTALIKAVNARHENGIVAEQQNGRNIYHSMSAIGG